MKREILINKDKNTDNFYLFDEVKFRMYDILVNLPFGEWIISIERKKSQRSISQNKLMWMWFGVIASEWSDAVGYTITPQMVHDAYAAMFLPVTMPNGNTIGGSTSGLTTQQMTEFLDKVQADAASEYGIQLPNPEDNRFEEWSKQL